MINYTIVGINSLKNHFAALLVNLTGGFTRALIYYHKRAPVKIRSFFDSF